MQSSLRPDDTSVPKIRQRPPQVSESEWKDFVAGLFPPLTSATHQLVPADSLELAADSGRLSAEALELSADSLGLSADSLGLSTASLEWSEESGRLFDVIPLAQNTVPLAQNTAPLTQNAAPNSQGAENPSARRHRVLLRGTYDANPLGECRCDCDAFRYGVYGVCPHILFALSQNNAESSFSREQPFSEIFLRHGLRKEIVFHAAYNIPRLVSKAAKSCFHSDGTLRLNDYSLLKTLIRRAAECRHELKIDNDVFAHLATALQQEERSHKITALFKRGAHSPRFETLLAQPLAAYQRDAAIQAALSGRFLLFDSSGLGKRRTAVAAAEILAETSGIARVLILTNTATLQTWRLELQQSLPQNHPATQSQSSPHGHPATPRQSPPQSQSSLSHSQSSLSQSQSSPPQSQSSPPSRPATLRQSPPTSQIIFGNPAKRAEQYGATTFYNIARYDDMPDDADAIVSRMRPDLVILDETHTLKRHGAEIARMVRRLESEFLFILSAADPVKIPGALMSFVDMIDRQRTGLLESFLRQHQQFDPNANQVRYVNMRRVAKTLPKHFRRLESAEYRRSLSALILHERYLPLNESQAKRHADLQSQWFRLLTPWKHSATESRAPNAAPSTPQAAPSTPQTVPSTQQTAPSTPQAVPSTQQAAAIKTAASPPPRDPVNNTAKTPPPLVPFPTLQKIQSLTTEMLLTANGVYKIDAMYDLLLEQLETPHGKAVVFAHDLRLLRLAEKKLESAPFDCGLLDRFMSLSEQKTVYEKFLQNANCRVLLLHDGVSEQLVFRQTQLAIELDFPPDFRQVSARRSRLLPHDTFRPCHVYPLISYGTIEHWFAKLHRNTEPLKADNPPEQLSVTLMTEQERIRYFARIVALSEQSGEPPMVA
ncbi:MAG: hypothetical protein LBJ67_11755 [Planctomycetaceae bacterium]|jgi:hypothetical protein|nr:hypothetical protein [Planctomycetaceae bacterium]